MTYKSFSEYAIDHYWNQLFKPGHWFSKERIILKSDDTSLTHIGKVVVFGSISPRPSNCEFFVKNLLSSQFAEMCNFRASFSINAQDAWLFEFKPWAWWKWSLYKSWRRKELPLDIKKDNVHLSVSKIDFNLETISKGELPEIWVEKQLFRIKDPRKWLTHLGGRFFNSQDNYKGARIGLYTITLFRRKARYYSEYNWWDIPNDFKLMSMKNGLTNLVKSGNAVYLPFVSLAIPAGIKKTTVWNFDSEDFMPNPRKRRSLFDILHRMDKSELDAYFAKCKVAQHNLDSPPWSEECLKVENFMSPWEKRWLRLKAVTAHQPNSVLGQILLEANEALVNFTLQYFSITADVVNQLKIGSYNAVEQIARMGRLSLLSPLLCGKLKLKGRVLFNRGASFKRTWSVAFAAIEVDSLETLKSAISADEKGNQLTCRDDRGVTALGLAVMKNKVELVQVLLEARAEVDQPSWGEETALCLALQFGVSREIVEELIRAGAKTTGVDLTGNSIRKQLEAREIVS